MAITLNIANEYDKLAQVIVGTAEGYHRNPSLVSIVNGTQQRTFERSGHPTEVQLLHEFAAFRSAMKSAGVRLYQPALAPDSVQDQTCPRDIGFVIGDVFVTAGMRHQSRKDEIEGIGHLLATCLGQTLEVPSGVALPFRVASGGVLSTRFTNVDRGRVYPGRRARPSAA